MVARVLTELLDVIRVFLVALESHFAIVAEESRLHLNYLEFNKDFFKFLDFSKVDSFIIFYGRRG